MPRVSLNGFDDQERNIMFVKTDFQVLKLKFCACSFKRVFYPLYIFHIASPSQYFHTNIPFGTWLSNLHV